MKFYDIVYDAARENGMTIEELGLKLGKSPRYIGTPKSRGSLPKVDNAAMILKACGYELCAVPKGKVPKSAKPIDF